jgi:hypothetical protein
MMTELERAEYEESVESKQYMISAADEKAQQQMQHDMMKAVMEAKLKAQQEKEAAELRKASGGEPEECMTVEKKQEPVSNEDDIMKVFLFDPKIETRRNKRCKEI